MGLIVKKDDSERDYIDGIEVIERSDTPDDLPEVEVELIGGRSAEEDPTEEAQTLLDRAGGSHRVLFIAGVIAAVVIAGIVGYLVGSGGFSPSAVSSAVLSEGQLGDTVASYSFRGARHDVSAQEAIESEYSLSTIQNEDGTYPAPSAETIISYVRNTILLDEAASRGIEISDEDLDAFAESMLGTTDYTTIADQYGVTEDQARQIMRESATIQRLQEQIAPGYTTLSGPSEPTAPADGNTESSSAEYAQYILDLVGDAWDAEAGTWAESDNSYSVALGDIDLASGSATYEQAVTAYYVAYQNFVADATELSNAWAEFTNNLYAEADITLYGVYA